MTNTWHAGCDGEETRGEVAAVVAGGLVFIELEVHR